MIGQFHFLNTTINKVAISSKGISSKKKILLRYLIEIFSTNNKFFVHIFSIIFFTFRSTGHKQLYFAAIGRIFFRKNKRLLQSLSLVNDLFFMKKHFLVRLSLHSLHHWFSQLGTIFLIPFCQWITTLHVLQMSFTGGIQQVSIVVLFFSLVIFTVGVISRSFLFTSICRRIYHGDSRVFFYGNENNLLHHRLCDQRRFSLSQIDLADSSIPEWFICNRSILMLESVHSGDWLSPTGSDGFVSDHATDYEIRYTESFWI